MNKPSQIKRKKYNIFVILSKIVVLVLDKQ